MSFEQIISSAPLEGEQRISLKEQRVLNKGIKSSEIEKQFGCRYVEQVTTWYEQQRQPHKTERKAKMNGNFMQST